MQIIKARPHVWDSLPCWFRCRKLLRDPAPVRLHSPRRGGTSYVPPSRAASSCSRPWVRVAAGGSAAFYCSRPSTVHCATVQWRCLRLSVSSASPGYRLMAACSGPRAPASTRPSSAQQCRDWSPPAAGPPPSTMSQGCVCRGEFFGVVATDPATVDSLPSMLKAWGGGTSPRPARTPIRWNNTAFLNTVPPPHRLVPSPSSSLG